MHNSYIGNYLCQARKAVLYSLLSIWLKLLKYC